PYEPVKPFPEIYLLKIFKFKMSMQFLIFSEFLVAFKFCYPGFFIQRRNSFGDQLIVGHRKSGVGEPGDTTNNNHNKDQEATSEQPVNNIFIILVCHVKFLLSTYYFSGTKPKEMPLLI